MAGRPSMSEGYAEDFGTTTGKRLKYRLPSVALLSRGIAVRRIDAPRVAKDTSATWRYL